MRWWDFSGRSPRIPFDTVGKPIGGLIRLIQQNVGWNEIYLFADWRILIPSVKLMIFFFICLTSATHICDSKTLFLLFVHSPACFMRRYLRIFRIICGSSRIFTNAQNFDIFTACQTLALRLSSAASFSGFTICIGAKESRLKPICELRKLVMHRRQDRLQQTTNSLRCTTNYVTVGGLNKPSVDLKSC